jgi:hypothetical protein
MQLRALPLRLPPPWPALRRAAASRAPPLAPPPLQFSQRTPRACLSAAAATPASPADSAAPPTSPTPTPAAARPAPARDTKLHRLDALLSRLGYCTRGEARAWVRKGRVTVKGARPKRSDDKAAIPDVCVDGAPLEHPHGMLLLLHKPAGVVCSHDAGACCAGARARLRV